MVYKVCKGGVRSGNTLRGLRTFQSKRYARQACVIGQSSLGTKDVSQLLESSTDDNLIQEALGSTNVILSLNKKQRWRIPATVSHMIKTGCFDHKQAQVSLLERHKLKRRANCVSFVCNRGRYGHVIPKQKRYFSFNLNSSVEDQSKRFLRRQRAEARAEAFKQAMATGVKEVNKDGTKTVSVFTIDGAEEERKPSTKPEYRLEVFYPCPKSCSLTFNPKYTDVVMEMNDEGKMEIRSNTNKSKKRRKHRKRLTDKDVQEFKDDFADDEVGDVWSFADDHDYDLTLTQGVADNDPVPEIQQDEHSEVELRNNSQTDNVLSFFITEALNAQSVFKQHNTTQERKLSKVRSKTPDVDSKSHILYTNEKNPRDIVKIKQKTASIKRDSSVILYKSRTILTTAETSQVNLKEKFGSRYSEAPCTPRRFVIDVTEEAVNMISAPTLTQETEFASYLVFLYDGFYDNGLDTFKVTFNSQICHNTKRLTEVISFSPSSIDAILKILNSVLLDMKQENQLTRPRLKPTSQMKRSTGINYIHDLMKVSVEALSTRERLHKLNLEDMSPSSEQFDLLVKDLDQDLFCEICYEDVNVSHHESVSGLVFTECGHNFCDNCLQIHFRTQIKNGHLKMTCPGYQCDSKVGPVTLLTLLHVEEVNQIYQHQIEEELEGSQNSKWCPNPNCGRIIQVISDDNLSEMALDVMCQCGNTVCFSCLSPPHWPAKCDQAEIYIQSLPMLATHSETDQEESPKKLPLNQKVKKELVIVEGRLCPACKAFLEKDGGCNHMHCKCGAMFCWNCMRTINIDNHGTCQADEKRLMSLSRRLVIRHVAISNSLLAPVTAAPMRKPRQKTTMYQKAMRQRLNSGRSNTNANFKGLARSIERLAYKDVSFKREIFAISGADQSLLTLKDEDLLPVSVVPHVMRLLHDFQEFKLALQRVSEFTFVLIHDSPASTERRRALKLANDIGDYCSFIDSIFEMGSVKDPRTVVKRLLDIKDWAKRALDILLVTAKKLQS